MKYEIIYADCPWTFFNWSNKEKETRGIRWGRKMGRAHYDCISTKELCSLPVKEVCAKDCVLFLWATYPKLPDAIEVLNAWGFEFKTVAFTWVKTYPKAGTS